MTLTPVGNAFTAAAIAAARRAGAQLDGAAVYWVDQIPVPAVDDRPRLDACLVDTRRRVREAALEHGIDIDLEDTQVALVGADSLVAALLELVDNGFAPDTHEPARPANARCAIVGWWTP